MVNLTGSVWFFLLIGKAGEFFFFSFPVSLYCFLFLVYWFFGGGFGVVLGYWVIREIESELMYGGGEGS